MERLALAVVLTGCGLDDRPLTVIGSLSPDGGAGGTAAIAPGIAPDGALTIAPTSVDLGGVTQGFAARARLRVSNPGSNPAAPPVVAWASGSDPDLTLIQNLCTGQLAPGEACDLRVQVVPSRVGPIQGTLQIAGGSAGTASLPFAAIGLEPGPLVVQPATGSFDDFGGVRLGAVAQGSFTVTNPGTLSSGVMSFAFNRPELSLAPAGSGDCVPGVTDLQSGQSCSLRVAFAPLERGLLEGTLSVTSAAAGSSSLTLRGRGLAPAALALSASLVDFGGVVPGDTASLDVEVENGGDEPLALAGAQLSAADIGAFRIADANCGMGVVLGAGDRCRIQLDYRPVTEGQPSAGELLVSSLGGELSERVALQGLALNRGNLLVEPLQAGQENFGDVRLGERISRVFRVSNPAQQPSGALSVTARNGFVIEPPSAADACQLGVTELGNAQSCSVLVTFAPTSRGPKPGALTVSSPLAGAKSLALQGRGIAPAAIETDTGTGDALLDFGRVTLGSRGSRVLTVSNGGDEPLPPPELRITGGSPSQAAAAFAFESACAQPLAAGAACQIALTFAPESLVPHAASLELGPVGAATSVLLLGEALEPGRLALAPADGSPDFGDVAVGSSLTRSFTVTNPGGGASSGLSVRTNDSQFVVPAGACAEAGADGLADGESCSFDVTFTPATNLPTEARLSVQAAASGETGIALRGRGRLPAALATTATERDLGRANIGQPSGPDNEFVWTISNGGDLPSGALGVTNANPADFDVTAETCSTAAVAGAGTCTVTIVFAPDAAGDRSTTVSVTDGGGQSVALQVTGFGVQLAAPGAACLTTNDCMSGVCTGGVCCDQECNLTCQSCATGQCLAQSGQEPCGNSGGVCFGLEQCALPAGGGCVDSTQCGGALVCKECLSGGSQCTPANSCCGGCGPGYQCVGGECGCPLQADGRQQIDCGAGVCAQNRANACCPGSAPAGCNCDPTDNLCKECLQNNQCTNGPPNSVATCNTNRTCSYTCQPGFKDCNGSCIANAACCGGCGGGQNCVNGQCVIGDGGSCQFGGTQCASGNCSQGRCCPQSCGTGGCNAQGSCACPGGQRFSGGQCRGEDGQPCNVDNDCINGCTSWSVDMDGDLFGDELGPETRVCGPAKPLSNVPLVEDRTDCCDASQFINPGITAFSETALVSNPCPGQVKDRDLNCDDRVEYEDNRILTWVGLCDSLEGNPTNVPCGQRGGIFDPFNGAFGPVFDGGDANLCGNSSIQLTHCEPGPGGACNTTITLAPGCR